MRMYTEPITICWQENCKNTYEDLNANYIKRLSQELENKFKNNKIELIETMNKGSRKNGNSHPHSWSIANKQELIQWQVDK